MNVPENIEAFKVANADHPGILNIINNITYHEFDLQDFVIDILSRIGGGSTDFFDEITRFVIGTSLTIFLLWFAASRKSSDYYEKTREKYLFQGFVFACARNAFMLSVMIMIYVTSVSKYDMIAGYLHVKQLTRSLVFLEAIFPPIEHLLHFLQVSFISMAFVVYLTKETFIHKYYIHAIYGCAAFMYIYSATERFHHMNPFAEPLTDVVSFGSMCNSDWMWHSMGIIFLIWPFIVIQREHVTWLTKTVTFILAVYFLYHFGKLVDIYTGEVYEHILAPIRHCMDLALFPLFLYIYVKENQLRLEQKTMSEQRLTEQLETFVRGTVHELRSPVAGIEGTLAILIKKFNKFDVTPDQDKELAKVCLRKRFCKTLYGMSERMHTSIEHVGEVLETMSDFGHTSDQSKLNYHNLDELLVKAIKTIEFQDDIKQLPRNTIRLNPIEGSYKVLVSPVKFRQIIDNLIRNAVYAILERKPERPEIDIMLTCDTQNCRIEIGDNGCGMNDNTLKQCFDKMYTNKGKLGTGLGLYFTKMFMQEFHGDVFVKSLPNKGTIVTLIFPIGSRSILGKECRATNRMNMKHKDVKCIVEKVPALNVFRKIDKSSKDDITGTVLDISDKGIGIELNEPVEKHQKVRIIYGKRPSKGEIRWVEQKNNKWVAGVEFDE